MSTTQAKRRLLGPRPCRKCGEVFKGVRCNPCTQKKNREWYYSDKGKAWYKHAQHRQRRHGLTMAQADVMITAQGGVCKACGNPPSGSGPDSRLGIDHDHKTGEIRGAICGPCNRALGLCGDDPDRLAARIRYLGYVY